MKTNLIGKGVRSFIPKMLREELVLYGVTPEVLKKETGLDSLDHEESSKVPILTELELWRLLEQQSKDPFVGLKLVGKFALADLGLFGYLLQAQGKLKYSCQLFSRYHRLIHEAAQWDVEQTSQGDGLFHSFGIPGQGPGPAASLYSLAEVHRLLQTLTEEPLALRRVDFQRSQLLELAPLEGYFGGQCEFRFGQDKNGLVYGAGAFESPLTSAQDPGLSQVLEEAAQRAIEDLGPCDDWLGSVQRALVLAVPMENFGLDMVARQLGLSSRSLQRELASRQMTFRQLVDEARHFLACRNLQGSHLSVLDVALLLGYAEAASFSRAFFRWQGQSPSQYKASESVSQVDRREKL